MRLVDVLRDVEQFLERIEASGDDLAEARLQLSARILLHEVHDLRPDLNLDHLVEAGVGFMKNERTMK